MTDEISKTPRSDAERNRLVSEMLGQDPDPKLYGYMFKCMYDKACELETELNQAKAT